MSLPEPAGLPEAEAAPGSVSRGAVAAWSLKLATGGVLELDRRPRVMGVLNLTPDSFSDGGRWLEPARAVERGLQMLAEGADLLDLGAESTRPGGGIYGQGADDVPAAEELSRLLPVLRRLRAETSAPLSVDTRKGAVARAALDAGADLINDVSLLADDELGRATAAAQAPLVLMHSRGSLRDMQRRIHFRDLLGEVRTELAGKVDRAEELGVPREQVIVDPGIGFGKTFEQNLALIRGLGELDTLGRPILVGASRKGFLGQLLASPGEDPPPPDRRLPGSLAAVAWAARGGASLVRVHDVAETAGFLRVWRALERAGEEEGGER